MGNVIEIHIIDSEKIMEYLIRYQPTILIQPGLTNNAITDPKLEELVV